MRLRFHCSGLLDRFHVGLDRSHVGESGWNRIFLQGISNHWSYTTSYTTSPQPVPKFLSQVIHPFSQPWMNTSWCSLWYLIPSVSGFIWCMKYGGYCTSQQETTGYISEKFPSPFSAVLYIWYFQVKEVHMLLFDKATMQFRVWVHWCNHILTWEMCIENEEVY